MNQTQDAFSSRGFLPAQDPLTKFESGSPLCILDEVGHDLPSRLLEPDFRRYVESLSIPALPEAYSSPEHLPELRLYFVRLGFLASAYVNQVGLQAATSLPANIARPLVRVANLLSVPPILNYAGYALYNWKRFDPRQEIALGNIDTIQNFVHLYDEHWFILVHIEIEALAAPILGAIETFHCTLEETGSLSTEIVNTQLSCIVDSLTKQIDVLKRIPERMSPSLYYKTFRPYIRFFEDVEYKGVKRAAMNYRGETGAQSSIMPMLVALLKIEHKQSILVDHLLEIRQHMPATHRQFIGYAADLPNLKSLAAPELFDQVLELIAQFREVHYGWAVEYIDKHVEDPRGTGGTPYMHWLKQLIDETRAHKNH